MSVLERLEAWLQIQWARFNLWCDVKRQYPKYRVRITYNKETGTFGVMRWRRAWTRSSSEEIGEEWDKRKAGIQAEQQRLVRLRSLMTPEERAADDARRNKQ